jgi:hypothetical protein
VLNAYAEEFLPVIDLVEPGAASVVIIRLSRTGLYL